MGMMVWLDLKGRDVAVFFLCGLLGYLVALALPEGTWSVYLPILVSYHLFLAWLVVTADHETGFSLPLVSTVLTHASCLVLVIALGFGRHVIPFFGFLRYAIAGLAIFERAWLFSGGRKAQVPAAAPAEVPVVASTGEDYQEWLRYLAQKKVSPARAGSSMKAEYEQWVRARAQSGPVAQPRD